LSAKIGRGNGTAGYDPFHIMSAMNSIFRVVGSFAVGGLAILLSGCGAVSEAWQAGREASAAADQIMLVRREPESFGYQRLTHQAETYPELGEFLKEYDLPDFLAETRNSGRHYMILYYVDRRQAYAARTRSGQPGSVEFAGPYSITDREVRLLGGFRREAVRRRAELAAPPID
jgi:hypothetical protein